MEGKVGGYGAIREKSKMRLLKASELFWLSL